MLRKDHPFFLTTFGSRTDHLEWGKKNFAVEKRVYRPNMEIGPAEMALSQGGLN